MWCLDPVNSGELIAELRVHVHRYEFEVAWVGEGWRPLVEECHQRLAVRFPDYELLAIKQSWGALAFQALPRPWTEGETRWTPGELAGVRAIVDEYRNRSESVCEYCGADARLREWRQTQLTLCDACDRRFPDPPGRRQRLLPGPGLSRPPGYGRLGGMADVHPDAWVSPHAVLRGDVVVGPGSRILDLAVIQADHDQVVIGSNVVVMEHAVLRGRPDHPLRVGNSVMIGPHTHLNGTQVEDEVFIATGASLFPGSRAGAGAELRINSVLHVNSRLEPGGVVPIGWIAAGDPAQLFSPDRHEELWEIQKTLDFPGTVYGVERGTSMREIMRLQSHYYAPGPG